MFDASQNTLYQLHAFVGAEQFCRRAVVEQRQWSRKPVCGLLLVAENRNRVRYYRYQTRDSERRGHLPIFYSGNQAPVVGPREIPTSG